MHNAHLELTAPPYVALVRRSRLGGVSPVDCTVSGHRHRGPSEQSNGGVEGCKRTSPRPQFESTARPRRSFHNTLPFYWGKREHRRGSRQPGSGRGPRPGGVAMTRAPGPASSPSRTLASGFASTRVWALASSPASSPDSESSPSLSARAGGLLAGLL